MDDPEWFHEAAARMLRDVTVMTLATSGPEGPWAADVYFAAEGWDLIFLSSPKSRHCGDLATQPYCAVTVHPEPPESWRDITGLQLMGTAGSVHAPTEVARLLGRYASKFPFAADLIARPAQSASLAASARPYVFRPTWMRLIDNSRGFGRPFSADVLPDGSLTPPQQVDGQ